MSVRAGVFIFGWYRSYVINVKRWRHGYGYGTLKRDDSVMIILKKF